MQTQLQNLMVHQKISNCNELDFILKCNFFFILIHCAVLRLIPACRGPVSKGSTSANCFMGCSLLLLSSGVELRCTIPSRDVRHEYIDSLVLQWEASC